jgi:hypothetical protein
MAGCGYTRMDGRRNPMSEEAKKYPIPIELSDLFFKANGLAILRDRYVLLRYFGYKLAARASTESERLRGEFWAKLRELYPELSKENIKISVDFQYAMVKVKEEPDAANP